MKRLTVFVFLGLSCGGFEEDSVNSPPFILTAEVPSVLSGNLTVKIRIADPDADAVTLTSSVHADGDDVANAYLSVPSDDGQGIDSMAGDGLFTGLLNETVLDTFGAVDFDLRFTPVDAEGNRGRVYTSLLSNCRAGSAPVLSNLAAPDTVNPSLTSSFLITVLAMDADHDIRSVTRTTPSGLVLNLFDNGTHGDTTAGDGIYAETVSVVPPPPPGNYLFRFKARDCAGLESNELQKTIVIVN